MGETEVTVGSYGRMIFEMCLGRDQTNLPEHFQSIIDKAKPLVQQLLDLNDEMKPNGYKIHGYKDKKGKPILSRHQRIKKAQERMMGTTAGKCKKGDRIWLVDNDVEMCVGEHMPVEVEVKDKNCIYVDHPFGRGGESLKLSLKDKVLKAPDDWSEDAQYGKYTDDYWLAQAEELGF
jgi:hypothetical protein